MVSVTSVVLVRRRQEPLAGRWSLPGGVVELSETLRDAVAREVLEETGLVVNVGPVIDAIDHIDVDRDGKTAYHFVIVDYLCSPRSGTLRPGDDVDDAVVADVGGLEPYNLTVPARRIIDRAISLYVNNSSRA
jgi:ADP-ribose pyrophosphatase YjhB (NUDIX family)